MQPDTKYANSGGVHIAYQVAGTGPDLVFVPGWVSHIEYAWEEPTFAIFLERLTAFSRLIILDRRGTGLSDRVGNLPTLEERMDDIRAVLDAAGSQQAFLFGISESGPLCCLLAATYPQRVAGLILYGTTSRFMYAEDNPWGYRQTTLDLMLDECETKWGTGISARRFAPNRADDEEFCRSWGRFERRSVSPGGIVKLFQMIMDTDVRRVLPSIRVPTLVLHRTGDRVTRLAGARYLAGHIPDAKLIELAGTDHFPWVGDTDAIADEVEQFVTGTRHDPKVDRILATILFVDIVHSTLHLAEKGDRSWRDLLQRFYAILRQDISRFRGREINTTGDGIFAIFDGPARAIRCACAMTADVRSLGVEIRSGLHSGECEQVGNNVDGIAVHIGARVTAMARSGEVLVSSTVKDLVAGSGLTFADRGKHQLKGVPGDWQLFAASA